MRKIKVYGILFLLILSIAYASAHTLVVGKTYNSDFTQVVSGAVVTATCNSNSLYTDSLTDGSYAIGFEVWQCNGTDAVSISASKTGLSGTGSGNLIVGNNGGNSSIDYISVINILMNPISNPPPSSSSGGSGGGGVGGEVWYYKCGNGVCDNGESMNTCPEDCNPNFVPLSTENNAGNTSDNETNLSELETEEKISRGAGITGAVIGFAKTKTGIGLIFAIIIIILGIAIMSSKGKKNLPEKKDSG